MTAAPDATDKRGTVPLVCPDCKVLLAHSGDHLDCERCGTTYPLRQGIPVFYRGNDFYEAYADEHLPYGRNPPAWKQALLGALPYWSWREWKFFRRHLRRGDTLIELGCGRGKEWFVERARYVAGIDPCWTALADCARRYDFVAQAEIAGLPFPDRSFDCAVTAHVLGHIPIDHKDAALAEVARVLKPGGRFVSIIETDSAHPFARYGKQDRELYHTNFIETDGHVGLELPSVVLQRLRRHSFEISDVRKMESGLIHLRYYAKYLGSGYPERDPRVRRLIARWECLQRSPALLAVYEIAMGAYYQALEPRLTPLDHAMFLGVCAVKRTA
jgi:SAM-dependent methyltransferase/ribosomal protein S27AE